MTRAQVDDWRAGHQLDPLTDREWIRKYAPGPQQIPLPFPGTTTDGTTVL